MAMVPRPLSAESAIVIAVGPNASKVTMRRSKRSTAVATGAFGRGQTSAAAISSVGSRKTIWLPTKTSGCRT